MTQTVLLQVFVLSAMMLLGFILGKRGYLKKEGVDLLTKLLMDVFLPCNVLAAASGDFSTGNLVQTAGIILLYYFFMLSFTALAAGVTRLLRLSRDDMLVLSRSVGYPNNGFMGLPLCESVFGPQGTVLTFLSFPASSLYITFNLVRSFRRESGNNAVRHAKDIWNPMNLSVIAMLVMIATGWKLRGPLLQFCDSFGRCVTPVAMLVIGFVLSSKPLSDAFCRPVLYLFTALRGLICPLLAAFVLRFTSLDRTICLCMVMVLGCSAASLVSIFASQYDRSPALAGEEMLQSTLLLPLTMPLLMAISERIL